MTPHIMLMILCLACTLYVSSANVIPQFSSHSPRIRFEAERDKPQARVLINSLPRSGSTFIGELFNQNPESAYLYEATRAIGEIFANDSCAAKPEDRIGQIITKLFNCDFELLKQFMNEFAKTKGNREYVFTWTHAEHNSSPGKCIAAEPTKVMMAIKEIVLWGPKLKWLLSAVPDLKIVSLSIFPSPRYTSSLSPSPLSFFLSHLSQTLCIILRYGWFVSSFIPFLETDKRENMYYNWGVNSRPLWAPYDRCQWINASQTYPDNPLEPLRVLLQDVKAHPHKRMAAWWTMEQKMMLSVLAEIPREKWMLVKYEDLSTYPLEIAQQIYTFLGKDTVHENVLRWVVHNTQSGNDTERYPNGRMTKTDETDMIKIGVYFMIFDRGRYGTARESNSMATVFLERIPVDKLKDIENIAGSLFDYFGYSRVTSNSQPDQASVFYRA